MSLKRRVVQGSLTVELSAARSVAWTWHFISHACAPAICYAAEPDGWVFISQNSASADFGGPQIKVMAGDPPPVIVDHNGAHCPS